MGPGRNTRRPVLSQRRSYIQVEMFGVTENDRETSSNDFLLELVDIQKSLFSELGLHFRY